MFTKLYKQFFYNEECFKFLEPNCHFYANLYFIDQEISLAMGLNCSIAYIIDFLAGILDPRIAETDDGPDRGVGLCLLVGTALCLLAFFLSIVIITLDNNAQKHDDILK